MAKFAANLLLLRLYISLRPSVRSLGPSVLSIGSFGPSVYCSCSSAVLSATRIALICHPRLLELRAHKLWPRSIKISQSTNLWTNLSDCLFVVRLAACAELCRKVQGESRIRIGQLRCRSAMSSVSELRARQFMFPHAQSCTSVMFKKRTPEADSILPERPELVLHIEELSMRQVKLFGYASQDTVS